MTIIPLILWLLGARVECFTIPIRFPKSLGPCRLTMRLKDDQDVWSSLDPESLVSAKCLIEQTLCTPSDQGPQLAKNVDYASAILDAWQESIENDRQLDEEAAQDHIEYKPVEYLDKEGTLLHGYIVRRRRARTEPEASKDDAEAELSPVALFFHTAAGPHDIFLLWKAASLITSQPIGSLNCQVMIVDLIGDDSGWAWDTQDRSKYNHARHHLLKEDVSTDATTSGLARRIVLQERIQAAIELLKTQQGVDMNRLAAFGWCLGGQAILEIGRMCLPNMRALVSFHGVFEGVTPWPSSSTENIAENESLRQAEVLICHGVQDPFVSEDQLETALSIFQHLNYRLSLLQLQAKHGFTNPAQIYNANPAFDYCQDAAEKAWRQGLALLKRNLSD